MLRALQETGGLEQRDGTMELVSRAAERLPATLTEVLLARLDRLEPDVRTVAQVASVIGRNFAVRLLAQIIGRDGASLEGPLTALQQAEIAFPRRGSDLEYVFKHVSMREVAYNTLVQKRRQRLHLDTARAIAQLYPPDEYVEMIAYHYARTEEHGDAAEWSERAGDRAAGVYANETAIGNYREAIRRLELCEAADTARARVDEKLAAVLTTVGRYDEALQLLRRADEVFRKNRDLERAGRTTARMGAVFARNGSANEGIAIVQPMAESLAWSGPSAALASLHIELARLFFTTGRYRQQMSAAERGAEIARAIGDERLLAQAEERRGSALALLAHVEESRRALEGVVPLAESVGDLDIVNLALSNIGETYRLGGNLDQAKAYAERALEAAHRIGDPDRVSFGFLNLGEVSIDLGEWPQARECLERSRDILRSMGSNSYLFAYPPMMMAQISIAEGDWDNAAQLLRESLAISEPVGDRQALENAHALFAEIELLQGHPEAAAARLAPLVSNDDARLALLLPPLALAQLQMPDTRQALELAQRAVDRAREERQRTYPVEALRVQGVVLAHQGRCDEAEIVLQEGLEIARTMPNPYAEARIVFQMGMMDAQQDEIGQARERLQNALVIFRRLGARKDVEQAEQALASLSAS